MPRGSSFCRRLASAAALSVVCATAAANSDPLSGLVGEPGSAGLGFALRVERSPYRDAGTRTDLLPFYLYEGKHFYLHANRIGLHLDRGPSHRFDVFLTQRAEGFPSDRVPASLAGMAERQTGLDLGASYELRGDWGAAYAELLRDVGDASSGTELRLGYRYAWRSGRLSLRPHVHLALREAKLNNYYYGVLPGEATATRPAYQPGAGANLEVGLYGAYALSERWRLFAGATATRWPGGVRASPIVTGRSTQTSLTVGLLYDFSPELKLWPESQPVIVRALYGRATDCDVLKIARLACTSTNTQDRTRIASVELGRPFIERLHGWPLDFVGFVGLMHHDERGVQPSFWQVNAYMKGLWYGFPWRERVMTRLGLGLGMSYAGRTSMLELRDQQRNGRNTSRLLNYLDPTIDVSVGDLLGEQKLRRTFVGLGVSHRSGIFGTSRVFGNVNGGSNYIYSYVETEL
jgi:outer membrane protein